MNRNSQKLLGIVFLSLAILLYACKGPSIKDADNAKAKYQYKLAADIYKQVASNPKLDKSEQKRAREEAATCYRMANEYDKAAKAYDKILTKDPKNTDALFYNGVMNMKLAAAGNPDALRKARDNFQKYLQEVPNDAAVMKKISGIDSAESWKNQPSRFRVNNLKTINTKNADFSPMISNKKDDEIVFTTDREGGVNKKPYGWTGNWHTDLWTVKQKKAKKNSKTPNTWTNWEKPTLLLGTVNSKLNDGTPTFDRKFATMYYTQCNGEGKDKTCKIWEATKRGNEWTDAKMLEFCATDTFNYGHPALNEDGTKLYFSSDRTDGLGGHDIWVVNYARRGKTWSEPINLGSTINTEKDEQFPYWNSHDQSLYFSSNGHLGMGGLDIFRSEGSGNEWSEPENLKAPLNSGGDDFGITFDINKNDHGYFTSNRIEKDAKGNDDIYEFRVDPLIIKIEGIVTDCNKKTPLKNSLVVLTNDKDTSKIILHTDDKGYYITELKEKRNYEIACSNRELYYFDAQSVQRTTVGIKNSITLKQDFCMISQIIERPYPIFYDLDRAEIRKDAAKILDDSILPLLTKYPKLRVELGSHTDCRSSYEYNIDLSQRRADSAVAYLVRRGIDPRRIVAKGYGESQLVNQCECEGTKKVPCSEEEHQRNRRTVIKTLDVNFDPSVKFEQSTNSDNVNEKPIIVKLTKAGGNLTVPTATNNGEKNPLQSLVAPGADIQISMNELKSLVQKGQIKQTDLTGITLPDITAGRLKPNATVKLSSLRIGTKDRNKTLMDVTVKIANIQTPYVFGFDALKAEGGTVNTEEGELTFKNVNSAALKGGPVDSKILNDPNKGTPNNTTTPPAADTVSLEGYVKIPLMVSGANRIVSTMVNDKENVNWVANLNSNKTEMDEETVKKLYENGVITKQDFEDGESIKLGDGTKLRSSVFIIKKLEISGVTIENLRVTVSSKVTEPVLGKAAWRKLNPIDKNNALYVKPKVKKGSSSED